jgi:hypothetical protein
MRDPEPVTEQEMLRDEYSIPEESECVDRTRNEYLREHDIRIKFHSVGCVIEVGCKSIPFSTAEEGMTALFAYVDNPKETTEFWNKKFQE